MFLLYFLFHINVLFDDSTATITSSDDHIQPIVIETYEEDITGDGLKETIELKGTLLTENNPYYRKIWVDITSTQDKKWNISFGGGYEPTLQFIDLNHDGTLDIFYQSATGGSGGLYNYYAYTLKNEEVMKIPLPKGQNIRGQFKNDYIIELQISPGKKPILLDVSDRSADYQRLNIYDKDGTLLEDKTIMIDPIAFFEPKHLSTSKGYALKSYQQISGAYHADRLGTIETLWYYEDGEWVILKTEWVPSTS